MKTTIIFLIAIVVMFIIVNVGYDKQMEHYCKSLQAQAIEYSSNPDYYITKLDSEECSNVYHIEIMATVK